MVDFAARPDLTAYMNDVRRIALLTAEETQILAWRYINDGDHEARNELIRSNLRLVILIAKRCGSRRASLADLIADGNIGLINAVERWDPARGSHFSTYAAYWIKKAIWRSPWNAGLIVNVPPYMLELAARCRKVERSLEDDLGRRPTQRELQAAFDLPRRTFDSLRQASVSLRGPCRNADSTELYAGVDERRPDEDAIRHELRQAVARALDGIDARSARVLTLRFGLEGNKPHTFDQVGRELGITREWARRLESTALRHLREKLDPACGG